MPFTITMPKLSPTMEEGAIAKWRKKEGEKVETGECFVEIATDKATVEYNALDEGFLRKILLKEGKIVPINEPIAIFSESSTDSIAELEQSLQKKEQKIKQPSVTNSDTSINQTTHQATPIVTSPAPAFAPEAPASQVAFSFPTDSIPKKTTASPLAKKLAKEKGLDLSTVKGSGPQGRIVSRDLSLAQPDQAVTFGRRERPEIPSGTYEEIPLSPMRKSISQRLQQAKQFIPHVYLSLEINAAPLLNLREQLKVNNLKPTLNDFVIRATALALREHPHINSGFYAEKQSIILFKTIDISIAVSVDGGLMTPIIRYADYKNVGEISAEVKDLVARAKTGKLDPSEYKGGSFTISNLGMYGITEFSAILNPPQAAILAVGGVQERLRLKEDKVFAGQALCLTLSVDHRVIDGAEGALFLTSIQKYLESPAILLV